MSSIRQVIRAINRMQSEGVVDRYAIGGAVGATFYIEPVATMDVDVFVAFRADPKQLLVSLKPIYDYVTAHGARVEGEHVVMEGWPIQFLPPTGPLVEEALVEAVTMSVGDTEARVFTAEHLAAIALQTGRAKDKARLLQFVEAGVLDPARFESILGRHGLADQWREFRQRFLGT